MLYNVSVLLIYLLTHSSLYPLIFYPCFPCLFPFPAGNHAFVLCTRVCFRFAIFAFYISDSTWKWHHVVFPRLAHFTRRVCVLRSSVLQTRWAVACQAPCPWDFPGKNIGVRCQFLLQGSFRPRGWTWVPCIAGGFLTAPPPGKLFTTHSTL